MAVVTSAAVSPGLAFSAAVICSETSAAVIPVGNLMPEIAVSMSFLVAKSFVASEIAVLMSAAARPGLLSMYVLTAAVTSAALSPAFLDM